MCNTIGKPSKQKLVTPLIQMLQFAIMHDNSYYHDIRKQYNMHDAHWLAVVSLPFKLGCEHNNTTIAPTMIQFGNSSNTCKL
jgi:uncharacterized membrane protein